MRKISKESEKLIKEHMSELELKYPLDDDDSGYKIFHYFSAYDGTVGDLLEIDAQKYQKLSEDVNRIVMAFNNPDEDIDYEDLERRLKSD